MEIQDSASEQIDPQLQKIALAQMYLDRVQGGRQGTGPVFKVPDRISMLPCGCERERGWEGQNDQVWRITSGTNELIHRECGRVLDWDNWHTDSDAPKNLIQSS